MVPYPLEDIHDLAEMPIVAMRISQELAYPLQGKGGSARCVRDKERTRKEAYAENDSREARMRA